MFIFATLFFIFNNLRQLGNLLFYDIHRFSLLRFENVTDEYFDLELHMPQWGLITDGTDVLSSDKGMLKKLQSNKLGDGKGQVSDTKVEKVIQL